jgi:hypothetical protein
MLPAASGQVEGWTGQACLPKGDFLPFGGTGKSVDDGPPEFRVDVLY